MKRNILGILSILVISIVSFIIGIQLASILENKKTNEVLDIVNDIAEEDKEEKGREHTKDTSTDYYLHRSNLVVPNKTQCAKAKEQFFEGVSEVSKEKIKTEIRDIHYHLEFLLVDTVSFLKDSNSPYWKMYSELGVHEEPNYPNTKVESHGFANVLVELKEMEEKIENKQIKDDFEKSCKLIQYGIDNHDIGKIFEAHETIHDYDYWVANSPLSYITPPADWSGIQVYFGRVSIM